MKRLVAIVLALLILAGCAGSGNGGSTDVLLIEDRFFVRQVDQIFADRQAYLGRTIRYEGIFVSTRFGERDFYFVIRGTHGCCGADGIIGFEVLLGDDISPPPDEAWVEVVGVLEEVEDEVRMALVLNTTSLTELDVRGMEFVE